MFYNMDLLCRKRQGKFAIIWFAATRGIRHVPKIDVQRVDVVQVCEQLMEYIMSNSQSPNKRLSLYLSAKLIHGTVLIYRQQFVLLQQEICTFIFSIRRPISLLSLEDDQEEDGLPKQTKEKKKIQRKKKEKAVEVPEPDLMQQVMQTALQINENMTDPIHITLREEVASQQPVVEAGFGDEGQLDQQLALLSGEAWTTALLEHPAPPVAEIAEGGMEKRKAQSPVLAVQSPSKRRRLEDGAAHAHMFPEVNIVQRGALSPEQSLAEVLRQEEQPMDVDLDQHVLSPDLRMSKRLVGQTATESADVLRHQPGAPAPESAGADIAITTVREPREAAMAPAPEELTAPLPPPPGRRRVIRTPRPRPPRQIDNNIETPSRWRHGNINRDFENDIFGLGNRSIPASRRSIVSSTPTRHQDPRDILREILADVRLDNDTDYMSLVLKDKSAGLTVDSVPAIEITSVTNQHNKTYLVPVAEQADVSVPMAALPQHGNEPLILEVQPIPEVQPPPAEHVSRIEQQEELNQIDVSAEYRQTFGPQRPRVHTSTPLPFDTESKRHGMLLTTIRNRFRENGNTPLKIEQLCVPLNRFKMATTFCALLSLEAKQYIIMRSAPGTTELDTITPGPRLWDL